MLKVKKIVNEFYEPLKRGPVEKAGKEQHYQKQSYSAEERNFSNNNQPV